MSVEEGFLSQLNEHPEDDSTRLAYADWLGEQGDPRGHYLRVEWMAAHYLEFAEESAKLSFQLGQLRKGIDRAWLRQAGKRFGVWLLAYPRIHRLQMLGLLRNAIGISIEDGKDFLESLPRCVLDNPTHGEAETLRDRFVTSVARFPFSSPGPTLQVAIRLAQAPTRRNPDIGLVTEAETSLEVLLHSYSEDKRGVVAVRLCDGLAISLAEADRMLAGPLPQTLARGLDLKQVEALRLHFQDLAIVIFREID